MELWLMPRGGFYLWGRLPEGLDAVDVARKAFAEDIVLAPGNVFSVSKRLRNMCASMSRNPAILASGTRCTAPCVPALTTNRPYRN